MARRPQRASALIGGGRPAPTPRALSLLASIRFRLRSLAAQTDQLVSEGNPGRAGVQTALEIIARYPDWFANYVDRTVKRSTDDAALLELLGLLGRELDQKVAFIEDWFGAGTSKDVELALVDAVERECEAMRIGPRRAVLAVGAPGNFVTDVGDLTEYLFDSPFIRKRRPVGLPRDRFAMVQVARFEGSSGLWWPIVLGHELAHLKVEATGAVYDLDLSSRLDWRLVPIRERNAFLEVAESWAIELLCDAYTVHRFGPAGAAAMAE